MKKILLATVAVAALSFPAMAQKPQNTNAQERSMGVQTPQVNEQGSSSYGSRAPQAQNESMQGEQNKALETNGQAAQSNEPVAEQNQQDQNPSMQSQSQQQAANEIKPSDLSKEQIRDLQQALNKKGFDTGHVDGIWGSDTSKAVEDFQKSQNNMEANGKLDQQTLQALGVQFAQGQQQQPGTVGAAPSQNGHQPAGQQPASQMNQNEQNQNETQPSGQPAK